MTPDTPFFSDGRREFVKKSLATTIVAAQPTLLAGLLRADGGGGGGSTTSNTTLNTTAGTTDPWATATTIGPTLEGTTDPWETATTIGPTSEGTTDPWSTGTTVEQYYETTEAPRFLFFATPVARLILDPAAPQGPSIPDPTGYSEDARSVGATGYIVKLKYWCDPPTGQHETAVMLRAMAEAYDASGHFLNTGKVSFSGTKPTVYSAGPDATITEGLTPVRDPGDPEADPSGMLISYWIGDPSDSASSFFEVQIVLLAERATEAEQDIAGKEIVRVTAMLTVKEAPNSGAPPSPIVQIVSGKITIAIAGDPYQP